jgi:lysophospholipase L1-like esterase
MNILIFTDCMAIGPVDLNDSYKYPNIIKEYCEKKYEEAVHIEVIAGSGETTVEALNKLENIKSTGKEYEIIMFAYGINDALPRGIKRSTRGKIIRAMYKLKLNERSRLFARSFFLNPLEFFMQHIRRPLRYNALETFINNSMFILNELKNYCTGQIICISINPVLNYRFVKGNDHIKVYNDKIVETVNSSEFKCVDVFKLFYNENLKTFLDTDMFHYSKSGHRLVADEIIKLL